MFEFTKSKLREAEEISRNGDPLEALQLLRQIPLDDFGKLIIDLPNSEFPNLSKVLPAMASEEAQRKWTGCHGVTLLKQTNNFVRVLLHNYILLKGSTLQKKKVLDFGCGYGRIIRSLYYYCDPSNLYGCDPMARSIEICRADRLLANLALSDYLPRSLPFKDTNFDLIFSFSVFTHLSERATQVAMKTLSESLSSDGVLAITIRPVEYWMFDKRVDEAEADVLVESYNAKGFSFRPHINRSPVEGEITYGDSVMSLEYLRELAASVQLRICAVDRTMGDPYQLYVFLVKDAETPREI